MTSVKLSHLGPVATIPMMAMLTGTSWRTYHLYVLLSMEIIPAITLDKRLPPEGGG